MVTKAKQKGHRWELLLSMAKAVQSELHADQEVRFASGMELLLRAVIELLEEPLTPSHNYVDNKIDNGVRRIQEEFRTHK
ncbi:MAG: hypothetical protein Q7S26_03705 [bacterium]|nr:hypothetical protein [bacterium]